MKRSEMVKYLQSNSKVELEEAVASYLLRLIESKGMLPPTVEGEYHNFWDDEDERPTEEQSDSCYTCDTKCKKCVREDGLTSLEENK